MRLAAGKLPVSVLRGVLRACRADDPSVLVGPVFGGDAAVVDLGTRDLLVLKSDPVTFTTDSIGWYAVHVNANDIAVMGATPRWFQSTILLPEGCDSTLAVAIARDIRRAARSLGITVTGGHTEVTPAVRQPVVAGDMQGLVRRGRLVRPGGARAGDLLLMTKSAGIEGTAILAREHARRARPVLGAAAHRRAACFAHRPGISIVREAAMAAAHGASAMHDPTEGGVAAGLAEMAAVSDCRLLVDLDTIPVHPITERLCAHFGLRPLGLIGSGALLATIAPRRAGALLRSFALRRVPARVIGRVGTGKGVEARRAGKRTAFQWSERDELARLAERLRCRS